MRLKYAEDFYIRSLFNKVKLGEVMTSPSISVLAEAPFRDVVKIFQERRIRHLPVVNSKNEVVGLMTQRDLYKIQPPHKNEDGEWVYDYDILDGFIFKNIMIKNPFVLSQDSMLAEAIIVMVHNKYGCIPVVDAAKKLCGIITQFDILRIAAQILEEGK